MLISIVIPHYNQPDYLRTCLQTLYDQEPYDAQIEIFVVDNGSRQMPDAVCADFPEVTLLQETKQGPGPARNHGVDHAKGDVLAFIDADCHAHPGWLAAITAAFADPTTQIAGGDVRVNFVDPSNPTSLEAYERIYAYRNRMYIKRHGYSGTGNLATRPAVIADVGGFAGIGVAEDRDWGLRAGAKGYRIEYLADMIVYHPARRSFSELTSKWDRHISHEFATRRAGISGTVKWFAKAAALMISPLPEAVRVARTDRLETLQERLLALRCLIQIRFYRARAMVNAAMTPKEAESRSDWTR